MHTDAYNKWLDSRENWITMKNVVANIIALHIVNVTVDMSTLIKI